MTRRSLALAALLCAGCGADPTPPTQSCAHFATAALTATMAPARLVVTGVSPRYDAGRLFSVSLEDFSVRDLPIEATGDTVARALGPFVALLHRAIGDQDNLTLYDPADGRVCQVALLTDAERTAAPTRPLINAHDVVALDARTLLVARYNLDALAVVDVASARVTRTVDLTPFVGTAPHAYPDALRRVGDEVWVTLQRDNDPLRANPTQPGLIVRFDAATLAVRATVTLTHPNPYGPLVPTTDGRALLVSTFGSYNTLGDGAVERIEIATGAVSDVVDERAVNGNIDAVAVLDATHLALRVSAERQGTSALDDLRVLRFDTETRTAQTLLRAGTWGAAAPVVVGERVVIADPGEGYARTNAGLRVFGRDGTELRARVSIAPSLLPYDVQPAR